MSIRIILISVALLLIFPSAIFAAEVNILPPSATVAPNSQFNISINITDVADLFAVAFDLVYDPAILEFVSAKEEGFLRSDGASALFNAKLLSDAGGNLYPGNLVVGYSRLAGSGAIDGKSGSGTLMTLTFNALGIGNSTLIFQNNHLLDPEIKEIATNWRGNIAKVEIPPVYTPLPTPSPIPSSPVSSKKMPSSLLTLADVNESMVGMVLNEISQSAILFISLFILTIILLLIILKEVRNLIKKR